jgi:hypothetical protein
LFGGIIRKKIFSLKELRKNGEDYPEINECSHCYRGLKEGVIV